MDRNETLRILGVLRAAYPGFYKDMPRQEAEGIVGLWQEMFRDDPYPLVAAAVKTLLATDEKGFPPHIGAVRAQLGRLTAGRELTAQEAWNLVSRAAANGTYGAEEEFERLPPLLRRLVGDPRQLRQWAGMEAEALQRTVGGAFRRSYESAVEEQHLEALLPGEVRGYLALETGAGHSADRASSV